MSEGLAGRLAATQRFVDGVNAITFAHAAAARAIARARDAQARGELTEQLLDEAFARVDELIAVLPPDPPR